MQRTRSIPVLVAAAAALLASSLAGAAEPADRAAMEKDLAAARTRLALSGIAFEGGWAQPLGD